MSKCDIDEFNKAWVKNISYPEWVELVGRITLTSYCHLLLLGLDKEAQLKKGYSYFDNSDSSDDDQNPLGTPAPVKEKVKKVVSLGVYKQKKAGTESSFLVGFTNTWFYAFWSRRSLTDHERDMVLSKIIVYQELNTNLSPIYILNSRRLKGILQDAKSTITAARNAHDVLENTSSVPGGPILSVSVCMALSRALRTSKDQSKFDKDIWDILKEITKFAAEGVVPTPPIRNGLSVFVYNTSLLDSTAVHFDKFYVKFGILRGIISNCINRELGQDNLVPCNGTFTTGDLKPKLSGYVVILYANNPTTLADIKIKGVSTGTVHEPFLEITQVLVPNEDDIRTALFVTWIPVASYLTQFGRPTKWLVYTQTNITSNESVAVAYVPHHPMHQLGYAISSPVYPQNQFYQEMAYQDMKYMIEGSDIIIGASTTHTTYHYAIPHASIYIATDFVMETTGYHGQKLSWTTPEPTAGRYNQPPNLFGFTDYVPVHHTLMATPIAPKILSMPSDLSRMQIILPDNPDYPHNRPSAYQPSLYDRHHEVDPYTADYVYGGIDTTEKKLQKEIPLDTAPLDHSMLFVNFVNSTAGHTAGQERSMTLTIPRSEYLGDPYLRKYNLRTVIDMWTTIFDPTILAKPMHSILTYPNDKGWIDFIPLDLPATSVVPVRPSGETTVSAILPYLGVCPISIWDKTFPCFGINAEYTLLSPGSLLENDNQSGAAFYPASAEYAFNHTGISGCYGLDFYCASYAKAPGNTTRFQSFIGAIYKAYNPGAPLTSLVKLDLASDRMPVTDRPTYVAVMYKKTFDYTDYITTLYTPVVSLPAQEIEPMVVQEIEPIVVQKTAPVVVQEMAPVVVQVKFTYHRGDRLTIKKRDGELISIRRESSFAFTEFGKHFAAAYSAKGMETLDDTKGFEKLEQCAFMATTADESIVSLHKLVKLSVKGLHGEAQWGMQTIHQIPSILDTQKLKLDLFNAQYIDEIVEYQKRMKTPFGTI